MSDVNKRTIIDLLGDAQSALMETLEIGVASDELSENFTDCFLLPLKKAMSEIDFAAARMEKL